MFSLSTFRHLPKYFIVLSNLSCLLNRVNILAVDSVMFGLLSIVKQPIYIYIYIYIYKKLLKLLHFGLGVENSVYVRLSLAAVPGQQHVPGAVLHRHQHSFRLPVPGGSATQ